MEKLTIHRALSELKVIDSKIEKAVASLDPIGLSQTGALVNGRHNLDKFEQDAKSKMQQISDLIKRKTKIKSAITLANATTSLTISGKTLTIAEAINEKHTIGMKKELLKHLQLRRSNALATMEKNNAAIEGNAIKLAEAALQKDNVKINDGDALAITEPYLKKNRYSLIDPIDIDATIEKLQNEISDFDGEVDAVLSEINATTLIEF